MRNRPLFALGLIAALSGVTSAEDSQSTPRPVPLTRPEMKRLLEDMKTRKPRIPLPELTEEEKAKAAEQAAAAGGGGRGGGGYEGRLRSLYMPAGEGFGFGGGGRRPDAVGAQPGAAPGSRPAAGGPGGFAQNSDEKMSLDYKFKVMLFWIVSRANNCQYCLGHQELKLLGAGMKEDEIAALDSDWKEFTEAEQAALAFARKFTLEPNKLNDADIVSLKKYFTDLQVLEMILSMAGNNSINRWKEGVGVPQSQNGGGFGRRTEAGATPAPEANAAHGYLTPTAEKYQTSITLVAPILLDQAGKPTTQTACNRPTLETREQVEVGLATARKRTPRLPLVSEEEAREVLGETASKGDLPQWIRLVTNFPREGKRSVSGVLSADEKGDLSKLLKAQVSWIIARQDRAWYATGQAKQRLLDLGQTEDQIYKLDGNWNDFTPAERAQFNLARKLGALPVVLTDDDVELALKLVGPRDVVQLVSYTTNRASFDRITESAGLQVEK